MILENLYNTIEVSILYSVPGVKDNISEGDPRTENSHINIGPKMLC